VQSLPVAAGRTQVMLEPWTVPAPTPAVVTVSGITFAVLVGGAIVTEVIFNIPGLGRLLVSGILRRDYPVVQGAVLVITGVYVLVNLLVDLTYPLIDPRVKYE